MFFHFVVKFNVLVDFVRVAKNLALYPRFMLSIQHVSIAVHNL